MPVNIKRHMPRVLPCIFTLVMASMQPQATRASVVTTFNTVALDTPMSQFVLDGITFSNPSSIESNKFVVEQSNWNANLPDMTPGNLLTTQSSIFKNTIDYDCAFTMTFASPITQLNMDMAYAVNPVAGGSISLEGFDSAGHLVASQSQTFFTNGVLEDHLMLSGSGISSVLVVPSAIAEGFSNISYQTQSVPEPSLLCAMSAALLLGQRGRRTSSKS